MRRFLKNGCVVLALALLLGLPGRAEDLGGGESGDPQTGVRCVALTFDDGPTGKITEKLLLGLRERYVSATFFLCGYRIEQFPELVKEMARDGHELGVHGCSHTFMNTMSASEIREELTCTSDMLTALTGERPHLFRPPGGLTSPAVLEETSRMDLPIILWSLDPEDWHIHDSARVVRSVVSRVQNGDVILMHDLTDSSVTAALQIIDTLQSQGYQFCTVSELAETHGITLETSYKYGRLLP